MARAPKLYTARGLFVDEQVGRMLGLPSHVRQAEHYIMATTKAEAVRLLTGMGHRSVRPTDLHVAHGNTSTALFEAGVAELGDLLVVRPLVFGAVVRVREGVTEVIGHTEAHPTRGFDTVFVPTGGQSPATNDQEA